MEINKGTYGNQNISALLIQGLESSYLISNSKNIDVVIRRYALLNSIIDDIKPFSDSDLLVSSLSYAIDKYKNDYPARGVDDEKISMLFRPREFNMIAYYLRSLANCISGFSKQKMEEIKLLKMEKAKKERVKEIIDTIDKVRLELKTYCHSDDKYNITVQALDELEKQASVLLQATRIIS